MKQSTINNILAFVIILLAVIIGYRYYNLNNLEHFQNEDQSNNISPPESTYNLQQYIATNPPTGTTIIKREVSVQLPDVVDNDITLGENSQLRFGSMRNDVKTTKDSFYFKTESDSVAPKMKLIMQDKQDKTPSFQIHGGACDSGNCALEGNALYKFDSQPRMELFNKKGESIHAFDQSGNAWHNGTLNASNVNFSGNANIKGIVDITGNTNIKGTLNVDNNMTAQDLHLKGNLKVDGKIEQVDNQTVQSNQQNSTEFINATKVMNAQDVNVRGRIYFSQTPSNSDPRGYLGNKTNDTSNQLHIWHDSDPFYIEKITDDGVSVLKITINDDNNDALEIWGGSCQNERDQKSNNNWCRNQGKRLFKIDGKGNVDISGTLKVRGRTIY